MASRRPIVLADGELEQAQDGDALSVPVVASGATLNEGDIAYRSGAFVLTDSVGEFDPRPASVLGLLIFTTSGGLVYDSSGDLALKETS